MKTNRWDDPKVDTKLYLLLQDLTSVFTGRTDFRFAYAYGSAIDVPAKEITGSGMWDVVSSDIRTSGYKSDVMLRAIGTMHLTDIQVFRDFATQMKKSTYPKFALQLAALLEDMRLEETIRKERPGTKRDFEIRTRALKHYFSTQLSTNVTRSYPMDELFCLIYLILHADDPDPDFSDATYRQLTQLETLKPVLFDMFTAKSTADVTGIAKRVMNMLTDAYPKDMFNDYVTFPIKQIETVTHSTLFDELTRTDPLANEDMEDVGDDNQEYFDQPFSTWHRENENSDRKQNFLQFELDVGTKTNIMGGDARETEDGDQAMGSVQGTSGKSDKNDYSETEALDKEASARGEEAGGSVYGDENKHAQAIHKYATQPTERDQETYEHYKTEIDPYRRRLTTAIEKTLEHKRNAPSSNLLMGRLSKNLLSLVVENNPRVFYKKSTESDEMDAAFTLLVDCSASMYNKMEETKRGIVLFHEVLQTLHIPHSIAGFWEDATLGTETLQPNYFHHVHDFHDSAYDKGGARIMQLEPEEDNRDGFSIRVMTDALMERPERHKFLLVFTDGEPAAMDYDQNGIIDTNVAVSETRKKGIEVVGMFLSDGEIDEQEDDTMNNIYGKKRLMIPSVSELPERFAPLLKRLLLQGM